MLSNKRRIIIIVLSVIVGSILAGLLLMMRKGMRNETFTDSDWSTMGINFLFALAVVFAIGILLKKMSR